MLKDRIFVVNFVQERVIRSGSKTKMVARGDSPGDHYGLFGLAHFLKQREPEFLDPRVENVPRDIPKQRGDVHPHR